MKLSVKGLADAQAATRRIERGTASMARYEAYVGSRLPYAYGQEYGRHRRSKKLARRDGGAFYLKKGVQEGTAADRDIAVGLDRVGAPGKWTLRRLAQWVRAAARRHAPVRSGKLRRSLTYEIREK